MKAYRIKNWDKIYEINRTRELKIMKWIPFPIKLDGDGYTLMMGRKDGAAIFGAWCAILQIAGRCDPRGTMVRGTGDPYNSNDMSRRTRVPQKAIEIMLKFCLEECKWLEYIDIKTGAVISQEGAGSSHKTALHNSTVHNNTDNTVKAKKDTPSLFDNVILEFTKMRTKIKKPLTAFGLELINNDLEKLAPNNDNLKIKILEQSIKKSWQGVFPLKGEIEDTDDKLKSIIDYLKKKGFKQGSRSQESYEKARLAVNQQNPYAWGKHGKQISDWIGV